MQRAAKSSIAVGTVENMLCETVPVHPVGRIREFGPRKTKELMLTGDAIDVDETHQLGMVSKIPVDELSDRMDVARSIAEEAELVAASGWVGLRSHPARPDRSRTGVRPCRIGSTGHCAR
jgi:hypothetical protein